MTICRLLCAVGVVLALGPAVALACSCPEGGCHCQGGCKCGSDEASPAAAAPAQPPAPQPASDLATDGSVVHVQVFDGSFSGDVTINVGDTVQWDWASFAFHTITSVQGSVESFDSGSLSSGSFSHTFNQVGTINYYCAFHGFDYGDGTAFGMAATVSVLPEPGTLTLSCILPVALLLRRCRD